MRSKYIPASILFSLSLSQNSSTFTEWSGYISANRLRYAKAQDAGSNSIDNSALTPTLEENF